MNWRFAYAIGFHPWEDTDDEFFQSLGCRRLSSQTDLAGAIEDGHHRCAEVGGMRRTNLLPRIWVPDLATRRLRQLLRGRAFLLWERTRIKNRIHGHLTAENHCFAQSDLYGKAGRTWLQTVALSPVLAAEAQRLLHLHDALTLVRWATLLRVVESPEHFLFYYTPQCAYFLPRAANSRRRTADGPGAYPSQCDGSADSPELDHAAAA